jgi:nucleotide-binding universal stress UspA family protein
MDEHQSQPSQPVILAAIDFSGSSALALEEAFRFAAERPELALYVLHVASAYGPVLRLEIDQEVRTLPAEEAEEVLAAHVKEHADRAGADHARVHPLLRTGAASDEIVAAAAELDAELVVVGTHGRTGVRRMLLGSVAEAVVRKAGCPVLVMRAKDYPAPEAAG